MQRGQTWAPLLQVSAHKTQGRSGIFGFLHTGKKFVEALEVDALAMRAEFDRLQVPALDEGVNETSVTVKQLGRVFCADHLELTGLGVEVGRKFFIIHLVAVCVLTLPTIPQRPGL